MGVTACTDRFIGIQDDDLLRGITDTALWLPEAGFRATLFPRVCESVGQCWLSKLGR